ncbi:MAG: isoprenylcysteine carboxylmethyltransferase family protein [Gemmatimonadota bacterium]
MDPQLIYAVPLAAALLFHHWYPARLLPAQLAAPAGIVLLIFSFMVGLAAVLRLRRARTTLQPWEPTTTLITDGPYRHSRNPIYVGYTLLYVGVACWANSIWPFVGLPVVFAAMHRVVIIREAYLERRFGAVYRAYRHRVRRWL